MLKKPVKQFSALKTCCILFLVLYCNHTGEIRTKFWFGNNLVVDPIDIKSTSLFWANLYECNKSVVVGSFIAKKFFLPTLSDAHLTAHFLRVAGAQICIWFGLQKHLSVSRFRFLFCKSSCCQPPKSICQSHVANFVSLISSLLPTFHPSVALNSFEISWNRNIVQNCPLLHWCHVKCQLN